jgi:hypothetical protein
VISAAHLVDLAAISLGRTARAAVARCEQWLDVVLSFRGRRAVILEALGGANGIDSLDDEPRDINDSLSLIDACFHVVTDPDG